MEWKGQRKKGMKCLLKRSRVGGLEDVMVVAVGIGGGGGCVYGGGCFCVGGGGVGSDRVDGGGGGGGLRGREERTPDAHLSIV